MTRLIAKPAADEFAPYAIQYIGLLPDDGKVLQHLDTNFEIVKTFVSDLSPEKLLYRYAEGKWTIKEILVHIVDDERIYAYRALRFARGDSTELPGFEQDDFALRSKANERPLEQIFAEYAAVRRSTIEMFAGFPDEGFDRRGRADGNVMSVRAAAYHIAGHELRHLNIIKEKYL